MANRDAKDFANSLTQVALASFVAHLQIETSLGFVITPPYKTNQISFVSSG